MKKEFKDINKEELKFMVDYMEGALVATGKALGLKRLFIPGVFNLYSVVEEAIRHEYNKATNHVDESENPFIQEAQRKAG